MPAYFVLKSSAGSDQRSSIASTGKIMVVARASVATENAASKIRRERRGFITRRIGFDLPDASSSSSESGRHCAALLTGVPAAAYGGRTFSATDAFFHLLGRTRRGRCTDHARGVGNGFDLHRA